MVAAPQIGQETLRGWYLSSRILLKMYFETGHDSYHTKVHKCLPVLHMILFVRNKMAFL
jgi:hypothetical protein